MYLTFAQYAQYGGNLDNAAFSRREYSARMLVDKHTFKRVANMAAVPESVMRLMFELIGIEEMASPENPAIASFSTDGYSESYAEPMTQGKADAMKEELIRRYLSRETDDNGAPLLYRGVG